MKKNLIGALFGIAIVLGGEYWSHSTGEGANFGAGFIVLAGYAVTLYFCVRIVRQFLTSRKS